MTGDDQNTLEIWLPIGTPDSIDSAFLCRFAGAYLQLLARIALDDGRELSFTGLRLKEGSTRLLVSANDGAVARSVAEEAGPFVSGDAEPPPGIEPLARGVSDILLEKLREGQYPNVIVGPWKERIRPRPETERTFAWEVISIRATVLRVGGVRPAARFETASEHWAFTLVLSKPEDAPALGALLYQDIDIVATVKRGEEDRIVGGTLQEWERLEPGSGVEAWRNWFRSSCPEWDEVPDVERELGRTDGEDDGANDRH